MVNFLHRLLLKAIHLRVFISNMYRPLLQLGFDIGHFPLSVTLIHRSLSCIGYFHSSVTLMYRALSCIGHFHSSVIFRYQPLRFLFGVKQYWPSATVLLAQPEILKKWRKFFTEGNLLFVYTGCLLIRILFLLISFSQFLIISFIRFYQKYIRMRIVGFRLF